MAAVVGFVLSMCAVALIAVVLLLACLFAPRQLTEMMNAIDDLETH